MKTIYMYFKKNTRKISLDVIHTHPDFIGSECWGGGGGVIE